MNVEAQLKNDNNIENCTKHKNMWVKKEWKVW